MREIIVDNFAGGGGASTGIALAIGRSVDIAVNHDAAAIQMHRRNHPDTKHYIEDVWAVDPVKACGGRRVGLAWFSPDCTHHSKARGGNAHAMGLVQAMFINRQFGQSIGNGVDEPLGTITAGGGGKSGVVATFFTKYHGDRSTGDNARGQPLDEPVRTVDTSNRFGLVSAFMAKHYGGGYTGCGSDLKEPIHTITSVDHNHLVTSYLIKLKGTNIGTPDTEPVPTICAGGLHIGEVRSFMIKYYGCGTGQPIEEPVHTITTKDRLGLVTIHGEPYAI